MVFNLSSLRETLERQVTDCVSLERYEDVQILNCGNYHTCSLQTALQIFGEMSEGHCQTSAPCPLCRENVTAYEPNPALQRLVDSIFNAVENLPEQEVKAVSTSSKSSTSSLQNKQDLLEEFPKANTPLTGKLLVAQSFEPKPVSTPLVQKKSEEELLSEFPEACDPMSGKLLTSAYTANCIDGHSFSISTKKETFGKIDWTGKLEKACFCPLCKTEVTHCVENERFGNLVLELQTAIEAIKAGKKHSFNSKNFPSAFHLDKLLTEPQILGCKDHHTIPKSIALREYGELRPDGTSKKEDWCGQCMNWDCNATDQINTYFPSPVFGKLIQSIKDSSLFS